MPGSSQQVPDTVPGRRDEVAEQRERHARALAGLPHQRPVFVELSEPDREEYEQRLDAYEVQLEQYRNRLQEYAAQLEAAHHDGLTGTWLRHAGRQLLEQELLRAERSGAALSIASSTSTGSRASTTGRGTQQGTAC